MKDLNTILRRKLFELLLPIGVPVYIKYIPSVIVTSSYILITTINSNDTSTMHSADTDTTVQIGIYTKDTLAAGATQADEIAAGVYSILYPSPGAVIDLQPEFQNCVLRLVNDISPDAIQTATNIFINRFITFRLSVFHK